jgi:hypothetical protein
MFRIARNQLKNGDGMTIKPSWLFPAGRCGLASLRVRYYPRLDNSQFATPVPRDKARLPRTARVIDYGLEGDGDARGLP